MAADVMDGQQVGMAQGPRRARLLLEAPKPLGVLGEGRREDLDCHVPAQARVLGLVDLAHAARSDRAANAIRAQVGPGGDHAPEPVGGVRATGVHPDGRGTRTTQGMAGSLTSTHSSAGAYRSPRRVCSVRVPFVYLLRCRDLSLYAGAAKDLRARLRAHESGRASRYTRARLPVALVWSRRVATWSAALRLEHRIKQLEKREKEDLVNATARRRGGRLSKATRPPGASKKKRTGPAALRAAGTKAVRTRARRARR